jgi:ribonuclease Z
MLSEVKTGSLTLSGFSLAGLCTSVYVKELDLLLDVGSFLPELLRGRRLFLSHGHPDHCGALVSWLGGRRLLGMPCVDLHCPPDLAPHLLALLQAAERAQGFDFDYRLLVLHPGVDADLGKDLVVSPLPLQHKLQTFGYLFTRRVQKLKQQWHGLSGDEIQRRKSAGEDLFREEHRPLLAYLPDTLPEGLDALPDAVFAASTLMVECTFLDDRKPMEAVKKGAHIHLDDLIPRLEARFRGDDVVLFHISRLYRPEEVQQILARRLPAALAAQVQVL